jgi:hypothetical protein
MHRSMALYNEEGAGNAGCWPHPRVLRAKEMHFAHASNHRAAEQPAFPAQWCYGLYALSPVSGLDSHRRSRLVTRSLISASGDQDHATSPSASAAFVSRSNRGHRIPAPRISDDRPKRPSSSRRDARESRGDLPDGASGKMCDRLARRASWADSQRGHAANHSICPMSRNACAIAGTLRTSSTLRHHGSSEASAISSRSDAGRDRLRSGSSVGKVTSPFREGPDNLPGGARELHAADWRDAARPVSRSVHLLSRRRGRIARSKRSGQT